MADFRADIIGQLGGRPTPQTMAFLAGWQRKEGGHTNNAARFNWLNRTDQGYPTMNKVGVAVYPDYQTGIARTAELLARGYPSLAGALRSGTISFADPNVQGDLNRWVTGKRTPGMTPYVSTVAKLSGVDAGVAPQTGGGLQAVAPASNPAPRTLASVLPLLSALQERREARSAGQRPGMASLLGALMSMRQQPAQAAPAGPPAAPVVSNGFLQAPTSWRATPHAGNATSNLGWGPTGPADIMAKAGTAVGAPEDGVVLKLGSAQGGSSMYFRGASGKTYWLGHVANSLPPGARVRKGQVITYISPDHPNPHLHIDRR